ncbi:MAG TPA: hypothetical protein DEP08_03355 [Candidatus Jacksonbacteria bacterium]|nr:hypothetical protein [Candidatus Jacksonbacteria bacterium]
MDPRMLAKAGGGSIVGGFSAVKKRRGLGNFEICLSEHFPLARLRNRFCILRSDERETLDDMRNAYSACNSDKR